MPIDSEQESDLIISDINEQKEEEVFKESLKNDPVLTCAFDHCTELDVKSCRKCNRLYCIMHANRFSPNFCKECFSNLSCIESKFTRTFEHYDEIKDQVIITKQSCTKYYMDGPDWPHMGLWISSLNDDELRSIFNFHFFVMKSIEAENEVRKIKRLKKLREQPTLTVKTSMKSVLKTTVQVDTADSLRKKFKKQGLPDAIIEQMIQAMNIKT